jgi:RNA polymerase sigma-70 factor (ECF subfamily)
VSDLTTFTRVLDEKYREVVLLRFEKQMSCAQIAESLNLPQGVVETRVFRATRLLKKFLEQQ